MIMAPWEAAGRLFDDRHDLTPPDPRVEDLARWRGILGLAFTVFLTFSYRGVWQMVNDALEALIVLVVITAVVVAIGVAVLYAATPPVHRGELRRGMGSPARTIGLALATIIGPPVLYFAARDSIQGLGLLVLIAAMLWWAPFVARSLWYLATSVLSVGEVHPMLAPICGTAAIAIKAVFELVTGDHDGLPFQLWITLAVCGVLSVAAVSAYEYALLHRYGMRLVPAP